MGSCCSQSTKKRDNMNKNTKVIYNYNFDESLLQPILEENERDLMNLRSSLDVTNSINPFNIN